MRNLRAATAAEALMVGLMAACAAAPASSPQDIPEPLRVASGEAPSQRLHAKGVQIYRCGAGKDDAARWEWQFKEPAADLFDSSGKPAGKHFAGPTWQAKDGSQVVGELVAHADSGQPGSIAWLLLRAKSTSGTGIFSHVRFIQRLHTSGGTAPPDGCGAGTAAQELKVPYSADYWFYG